MNSEKNGNDTMQKTSTSSRRKFIKSASAGAVLATIPAKSVWATYGGTNGVLNSIQASSHASGWTSNSSICMLPSHVWKDMKHYSSSVHRYLKDTKFSHIFGIHPYGQSRDRSLRAIIKYYRENEYGGPGKINFYMVQMHCNACFHGRSFGGFGVHFPITQDAPSYNQNAPFASQYAYSEYLKGLVSQNGEYTVAYELSNFLHHYA